MRPTDAPPGRSDRRTLPIVVHKRSMSWTGFSRVGPHRPMYFAKSVIGLCLTYQDLVCALTHSDRVGYMPTGVETWSLQEENDRVW